MERVSLAAVAARAVPAFCSLHPTAGFLERTPLVQLVDVARDVLAFPLQVFIDRAVERRVRQPVEGPRRLGQEAARMLVLPLRAALEECDAALDAELQRLVVARLEVQAGDVFEA